MTRGGSTLRVGFIGAGFSARLHAEAYRQVRSVDVALARARSAVGARLVNYADDFVVLCRDGAAEVLAQSRRWFTQMGLMLNEYFKVLRDVAQGNF